jgi:scyllo-inositol 2-dehydrogenase (NADP+)
MKPIVTALVGYGLGGKVFHAPLLQHHNDFDLKYIVQRSQSTAQIAYPQIIASTNIDEVINDKEVELVVLSTPNTSHFELAKHALTNGKHVVVDKPLTPTSKEAFELLEIAQANQRLLSVFQNRRWDGDFLTIQEIVQSGQLGRIVEYEAHFDRFTPENTNGWRDKDEPGSGILFDLGAHLIDQAICLFGLPKAVYADIRKQRENSPVDDYFDVQLIYPQLKVILKAGMMVKELGPRFAIHGTKGSFVKYGIDPQEEALKVGQIPSSKGWGEDKPDFFGILNVGNVKKHIPTKAGNYSAYYNWVSKTIRNNEPPLIKADEAAQVIKIIEFCFESNQIKGIVYL